MTDPRSIPPQVLEALKRGNKIEAIKLLRQATGVGLAEAKGAIDSHESAHGGRAAMPGSEHPSAAQRPHVKVTIPVQHSDLGPGEVPRTSGNAIAFLVLVIAAAIALWFALK